MIFTIISQLFFFVFFFRKGSRKHDRITDLIHGLIEFRRWAKV